MENQQLIESLDYHLLILENSYTVQDVIGAADRAFKDRLDKYDDSWFGIYNQNKNKGSAVARELANASTKDLAVRVEQAVDKKQMLNLLIKDKSVPMDVVRKIAKQSIPNLRKKAQNAVEICNTLAIKRGFDANNGEALSTAMNAISKLDRARFLAGELKDFRQESFGHAKWGGNCFVIARTEKEADALMKKIIVAHDKKNN